MKIILLIVITLLLFSSVAYCQDAHMQELLKEVAQTYTTDDGQATNNNSIAGFSLSGIIGGFLFGGIGFMAFVYGKKNLEFRPAILGIFLMVYPYFIRNSLAIYLIGITLTVVLFVWRD